MNALSTSSAFSKAVTRRVAAPKAIRSRQVTRAISDTQLVISGATAVMLSIGRFIALPYQKRTNARSVPTQNGVSHAEAGDALAQEATFVTTSNDPEGFTIVDVMAYGALGHALGFFLLASSSLAVKPIPF